MHRIPSKPQTTISCIFHRILSTQEPSKFFWVEDSQEQSLLEPILGPHVFVHGCRLTPEPPPLSAPSQLLRSMFPATLRLLPNGAIRVDARWRQ